MCALGFACATFVGRSESAQPVVTGATLPLFFISGVFVPWQFVPRWLQDIALVGPISHLGRALLLPYSYPSGAGFSGLDLLVVAGWGLAGAAVAARRFQWMPKYG